MSSTNVLIYVDVISNKQSIFSSQICTPSFSKNWPSLVSTAWSPIILWRLWSHKPSYKHDSNKYQSKTFVICDHKSDETRTVTHENKAYLVWLMFQMLSNQYYPHRANQKLHSWANAVFQNRGVCGQAVPSFPFPSPVTHFFFLLLSQLSGRTSRRNTCYAGYSKTHKYIWNFSQHNVCPKTILLWPTKIVTLSDMSFPKRKTMVCCFIPHLTGLKLQQASLKYFSLIKAMCQTTSSDTTAWEMTFYIKIL